MATLGCGRSPRWDIRGQNNLRLERQLLPQYAAQNFLVLRTFRVLVAQKKTMKMLVLCVESSRRGLKGIDRLLSYPRLCAFA